MSGLVDRRILVAEDECLIAMLIEDCLRQAGAEVVGPAASAEDALRLLAKVGAEGALDAAVLDVRLSDGSVLPVADKLAALGVPFVFATGYEAPELGRHAAAPVLPKPISTEDLMTTLMRWMRPAPRHRCAIAWRLCVQRHDEEEASVQQATTIGLDLAKNVF